MVFGCARLLSVVPDDACPEVRNRVTSTKKMVLAREEIAGYAERGDRCRRQATSIPSLRAQRPPSRTNTILFVEVAQLGTSGQASSGTTYHRLQTYTNPRASPRTSRQARD